MSATICQDCKQIVRDVAQQEAFWANVEKSESCWVWRKGRTAAGYGQTRINGEQIYAHRLAWMLSRGPIPNGLLVCHHYDNPPCVRPEHLFLGTRNDNVQDMCRKWRRGVVPPLLGSANHKTKLRHEQVREARKLYAAGRLTMRAIGTRYGVSRHTIADIIRERTWQWL